MKFFFYFLPLAISVYLIISRFKAVQEKNPAYTDKQLFEELGFYVTGVHPVILCILMVIIPGVNLYTTYRLLRKEVVISFKL